MFDNRLVRYLFLFGLLVLLTVALFRSELSESALDSVNSLWSSTEIPESMHESDFSKLNGTRFENERNNLALIVVNDLKVVDRKEQAVTISVKISCKESGYDYPGLRVAVLSSSGAKLRTIEFGASEYAHGTSFGSEAVELHIQTQPMDAGFAVSAFYNN